MNFNKPAAACIDRQKRVVGKLEMVVGSNICTGIPASGNRKESLSESRPLLCSQQCGIRVETRHKDRWRERRCN